MSFIMFYSLIRLFYHMFPLSKASTEYISTSGAWMFSISWGAYGKMSCIIFICFCNIILLLDFKTQCTQSRNKLLPQLWQFQLWSWLLVLHRLCLESIWLETLYETRTLKSLKTSYWILPGSGADWLVIAQNYLVRIGSLYWLWK